MIGATKVAEPLNDKILVIHDDEVLISTENLGYYGPARAAIAGLILETGNRFIAGINLYPFLASINNELQHVVPGWKMRITGKRRHGVLQNGKEFIAGSFFIDYIAIDSRVSKNVRIRNRINIINLELFIDHPPRIRTDQLRMVKAIIDLHYHRGINKIRTSRGAVGAALLKQSPRWTKDRHATSKYINDASRHLLPGNFYSNSRIVAKDRAQTRSVYYLDQDNAHHSIAITYPIPHPNYIKGRGYYKTALNNKDTSFYPIWCTVDQIDSHIGLFLCKINKPHLPPNESHLYPPWVKSKRQYAWLWTPDIQFAQQDQRLEIYGIVGGFSTTISDPVISEYGAWAIDYLKEKSEQLSGDKKYVKGLLHAAYGMLAFDSSKYKKLHRYWGGKVKGKQVSLPGAGMVAERQINLPENIQHPIINVIGRGIIEAETRRRTISYAKELYSQGISIPQIYADGLLVESQQLPFTPDGWRIVESLTNCTIPRTNAFISDQLTKLPGIPLTEEDIRWMNNRDKSRKPLTSGV